MPLGIASGALIWADYQRNQTHVYVNEAEYTLGIISLVCIGLTWYLIINHFVRRSCFPGSMSASEKQQKGCSPGLFVVIMSAFYIAYSSVIIVYFESQDPLPFRIVQMALAMIVLEAIFIGALSCYCILFCCAFSYHAQ
jgi:hypothetical protein